MATASNTANETLPVQNTAGTNNSNENQSLTGQAQQNVNANKTFGGLPSLSQPSAILDTIKDMFEQASVRKAVPIIIAVVTIIILASMYSSVTPDEFRSIYPGMVESDRQLALENLKEGGFDAEIDESTGHLIVPSDEYHKARIFLSSKGIPQKPIDGGFESLKDQTSMTTSQFMEQARYINAMEQELARSVSEISSIQSARVHLALPKQSVFVRDRRPAKASVVVTPFSGRGVNLAQVQAIIHLISSSVPNLLPKDVAVVDNFGSLLTDNALDPTMGLSAKQLAHKQNAEETYKARIMQLLTPVVGEGNVRSQVNLDMNFTQIESTFEDFDRKKEGPKTRSEVLSEDRTYRPDPSGIPGSYSNAPPPDARLEADGVATDEGPKMRETMKSRTTRNYEIDRTVRHVKNPTGVIERVSVAVVINEKDADIPEEESDGGYTKEELLRLTSLIQGVIGYSENRGDVVTLIPAKFEKLADPSAVPWYENEAVMDAIKLAVMAILFLLILLTIIRPIIKSFVGSTEIKEETPEELEEKEDSSEEDSDEEDMDDEDEKGEDDEEEKDEDADDDMVEMEEGESLEDIKAKLKPKKSSISLDMLDTANSYDDKVAIIRLLVSEDSGRVAQVLKKMIDE